MIVTMREVSVADMRRDAMLAEVAHERQIARALAAQPPTSAPVRMTTSSGMLSSVRLITRSTRYRLTSLASVAFGLNLN